MELRDFIYSFNLATTKTAKDIYEKCAIINSGCEKEIDYTDCVSLYDLVRIFNDSYVEYLNDKEKLKEIISKLGEEFYYFEHTVSDEFSLACFEILNPFPEILDEKRAFVKFINNNDHYYATADNGKICFHKGYKGRHLYLDLDDIKTCSEIVKRNDLFLESFSDLRIKHIFGDGTTTVNSEIEGEIFDKLTTFTLSFGNGYLDSSDYIRVKFRLGSNLEILYDNSKVTLDDKFIKNSDARKEVIDELLSSIYVNNEKLSKLYKQSDSFKKVYIKGGLK